MMKTAILVRQLLNSKSLSSRGFTLQELLISAGLMGLVITGAGSGVVYMMNNQKNVTAQAEGRIEINQAIDVITNEIRQAETVEQYINNAQLIRVASNFTLPTGVNAQPVLFVNLPQAKERIVYFVADKPANSPWSGPQIIYRWGPAIDANGNYLNLYDPTQWKMNPLVDQIDNTPLDVSWNCPDGTLSPSTGATGFYACVKDGKTAQLYINGKIAQSKGDFALYETTTEAGARAAETVLNTTTSTFTSESVSSVSPSSTPVTTSGNACAPIDLGAAGDYAVIAMNAKLRLTNSQSKIGTAGSNGNVGMGPGVASNLSDGQIFGTFAYDETADFTLNPDGTNDGGGNVVFYGAIEQTDLDGAVADVYAAATEASSLTPTQTFDTITDDLTISATATDGVNVIDVTNKIQLSGGVITIDGSANDFFVINVAGNIAMSGSSKILLSGGITPSNVLFNVGGDLSQSGSSIANGTFLVPYGKAVNDSANFYGAVYSPEVSLTGGAGTDGFQGYPFGVGSSCGTTANGVGTATDFAILGLNGGNVIINSSTSLIGDVGYSKNVTSLTNQKVTTFNSAVYVHGTANFVYTDKNFIPSGGITVGGNSNTKVEQASNDAIAASAKFAQMTPTHTIGALGDDDNYTITSTGDVNVISLSSLDYKQDTLTLVSRAGSNDVFIINVTGSFDFSGSTIQLSGVTADHVIFNFPNASEIMINKDSSVFNGTILAPIGNVEYHNPATFNGAIYAKNINLHSMFKLNKASFTP